jgi:cell division protein FtsN
MLGLVLFFVGMLVGAGLFMDPDEQMAANEKPAGQAEILATLPESPTSNPAPTAEMPDAGTLSGTETSSSTPAAPAVTDDPVGDLIAERSAVIEGEDEGNTAENGEAANEGTTDGNNAPVAPEMSDAEKAAARAEQADQGANAPRKLQAPEIKSTDDAAAKSSETTSAPAAPAIPEAPAAAAENTTVVKKTEPAATSAPKATASGAAAPFSVQVGAFKVHENASQRAEELRKLGLEVAVVARGPEGDATWYYVRVGRFTTMKEARDKASAVKKDQNLDGFPVRAEPNDREVN